MVVGIITLTGSVKSIEASLSSFKSAAQELFGRKKRLTPSEVTKTYKGAKLITSFDDFTEYAKGFLDEDALQYAKEVLGNDADDTTKLKRVAQLIEDGSGKIGKKLSKSELKAGLDALWNDGGVEGALAVVERCSKWYCKADLGNKFDYFFGRASGSTHNIQRSKSMQTELRRIGIHDTPSGRECLQYHFNDVVNDITNIVNTELISYTAEDLPGKPIIQYTATIRESLLMGPGGAVKLKSVWDGTRLLTVVIKGGK